MRTDVTFSSDRTALATLNNLASRGAVTHYEHVAAYVAVQRLEELIYRMEGLEK